MLRVDVQPLVKALQEFRDKNRKGFTEMVKGFSYEVTSIAIGNTPLGDSFAFSGLYAMRETDPKSQSYGLYPFEGFARGSWRVLVNEPRGMQYIYGDNSGNYALQEVKSSMKSYTLGDKVYISNYGPYIKDLEQNSSTQTDGQGIVSPTIDSVMRISALQFKSNYDKGSV